MSHRATVLSLYRQFIKESSKFTSYNFRDYAKNRIHHEFELNKTITDPAKITSLIAKGQKDLESLKRQVLISSLYPIGKNVLE